MAARSADGILFLHGVLKKQWTRIIRERLKGGAFPNGPPITVNKGLFQGGRPSKGTPGLLVSDGPRLLSMGNL